MFRPLPTSVLRLGQRRTSQLQLEPLEARRLLAFTSELIADVNAVGADSTTANFVAAAGTVFFHTSHFGHGMELWKTDGSREGTALVKTIEPSGDANIRGMIEFKGKLFLFADDGEHGTELWTSDGTESGTSLFKDIAAGPESSQGRSQLEFPNFTVVGDTLYFTASDMEHGMELWRTDGTSAGTTMVADLHPTGDSRPGGALPEMVALGQQLVFLADDGSHGVEIWTTDGTVIGTTRLTDFPAQGPFGPWPGGLKVLGNQVLFTAPDDAHGYELWATNGTVAGTHLVKDILPGSEGSFPAALGKSAILNGAVVFGARDNEGFGLFRSDGTEAGTYRL